MEVEPTINPVLSGTIQKALRNHGFFVFYCPSLANLIRYYPVYLTVFDAVCLYTAKADTVKKGCAFSTSLKTMSILSWIIPPLIYKWNNNLPNTPNPHKQGIPATESSVCV